MLFAADNDLPPVEVLNQGRDGELIHGLLTDRPLRSVSRHLPGPRLRPLSATALMTWAGGRTSLSNFPKTFTSLHELRMNRTFPQPTLFPITIHPVTWPPDKDQRMHSLIREVAED